MMLPTFNACASHDSRYGTPPSINSGFRYGVVSHSEVRRVPRARNPFRPITSSHASANHQGELERLRTTR
jgi:hypothetical protein